MESIRTSSCESAKPEIDKTATVQRIHWGKVTIIGLIGFAF
ncbi:MAG: hypothetical protein V2B20_07915 [Pseudomonadota bacterium]